MKKTGIIILGCLLMFGCKQEVLEPEQQVAGKYALDDGSGLTKEYIDFDEGYLHIIRSDIARPLAMGKIWHTSVKEFQNHWITYIIYSIVDGILYSDKGPSGAIVLRDDVLTIGESTYSLLKGFESGCYSSISIESEVSCPYYERDISIPFSIVNPIPSGVVKLATEFDWITDLRIEEGMIIAHVSGTSKDRTGAIKVSYTEARDELITIKQVPSTYIKPASETLTVDYTASTHILEYTIDNPVTSSILSATTNASWINDIQVTDGRIAFKVSENNSGSSRSTSLILSYAGAPDVTVPITQTWSATSIVLSPESAQLEYTGGTYSFTFDVLNPRDGVSCTATSQAMWITDVMVIENTVSYKVRENNSGDSKTGKIKLTYGTFATAEFSVIQSWTATSIVLTPVSSTSGYSGGDFSFSYEIQNPREGISCAVTSLADWITDVIVTGNTISYKVGENNTGASRTGKIKLTYGNYATAEFSITQSWTDSSISLDPVATFVNYTSGSYSFCFEVQNPREGVTATATTQSGWISFLTVFGNTVSYMIAENNSASARSGIISLSYGAFASADFFVQQSGYPITSLVLGKTTLSLLTGSSERLVATVVPADAKLIWTSENPSIAKVNEGTVTGVGNGTTTITVKSKDGSKSASCIVTVTTAVTGVTLNKTSLSLEVGQSETLIATVSPTTASNKSVTWSSSNSSVASVTSAGKVVATGKGTATITVTTVDGGKSATCAVTAKNPIPSGAVDLGLSVYWATCNLGTNGFASSPEGYGAYYAWGETATKSNYAWSTYKFGTGSSGPFSKYNTQSSYGSVDNKTVLETGPNGDDVASKVLGGGWRMPTREEFQELIDNCTVTWTTQNGVYGRLFTSKKTGYTEKSIFFPAAGRRTGSSLEYAGSRGYYWASSLDMSRPDYACHLHFRSTQVYTDYRNRYDGLSIRPVSE